MGAGSFPGLKRLVRGVDHPSPTSAVVKEEWSYTWAFVACSRVKLSFTFSCKKNIYVYCCTLDTD